MDAGPSARARWAVTFGVGVSVGAGDGRFLLRGVSCAGAPLRFTLGAGTGSDCWRAVQWGPSFLVLELGARAALLVCDFSACHEPELDSTGWDTILAVRLRGVLPYVAGLFCPLPAPVPVPVLGLAVLCFEAIVGWPLLKQRRSKSKSKSMAAGAGAGAGAHEVGLPSHLRKATVSQRRNGYWRPARDAVTRARSGQLKVERDDM